MSSFDAYFFSVAFTTNPYESYVKYVQKEDRNTTGRSYNKALAHLAYRKILYVVQREVRGLFLNQLEKDTVVSFFWKFFERGGNQIVALVVQIVMARLLAPEEFGILAIMQVFISISNIIIQSGLNTSLVQAKSVDKSDFSTVFWVCFTTSIVLYLILWFSAPFIADFYNSADLAFSLRILSIVIIVGPFASIASAKIQREMKFKKIFGASLTAIILSGSLGIFLALFGFGIWSLVFQQLSYQVINGLVLCIQIKWFPSFVFNINKAKRHFKFGVFLLMSGLLDTLYQGFSDLLIGKMFSATDLGVVSQGKKYPCALGTMLDGSIQPVVLSALSRIQSDIAVVKGFVRRALKTATFIIFPAMAMAGMVAEPLIRVLLGEQWAVATPFFQMYCFVYALWPIHTTNLQAINALGKSGVFFKLEIIKVSYGVIILLMAACVFQSIYAVVFGYVVSGIISTFVNSYPNRKLLSYSYAEQVRDIAPAVFLTLASLIIAVPFSMLGLSDVAAIAVQCLVFVLVFVVLSVLFKVESLRFVVGIIKQLIGR